MTAGKEPITIHRHVTSGSSFGANPLRQTIGLAKADRVAVLQIDWPTSGTTQVFRDIAGESVDRDHRARDRLQNLAKPGRFRCRNELSNDLRDPGSGESPCKGEAPSEARYSHSARTEARPPGITQVQVEHSGIDILVRVDIAMMSDAGSNWTIGRGRARRHARPRRQCDRLAAVWPRDRQSRPRAGGRTWSTTSGRPSTPAASRPSCPRWSLAKIGSLAQVRDAFRDAGQRSIARIDQALAMPSVTRRAADRASARQGGDLSVRRRSQALFAGARGNPVLARRAATLSQSSGSTA